MVRMGLAIRSVTFGRSIEIYLVLELHGAISDDSRKPSFQYWLWHPWLHLIRPLSQSSLSLFELLLLLIMMH